MNTQITSLSIPHWKFHAFAWAIQINTEGEEERKFASVSIMTESVGDKLTIGLACYVFYSKPKYRTFEELRSSMTNLKSSCIIMLQR